MSMEEHERKARMLDLLTGILEFANKGEKNFWGIWNFLKRVEKHPDFHPMQREFLRSIIREGGIKIKVPALPRFMLPTEEVGVIVESVKFDDSPTTAGTIRFISLLREGESSSLSHEEYKSRLALLKNFPGRQHAIWIVQHQDELPIMGQLRVVTDFHDIAFPGMEACDKDQRTWGSTIHASPNTPWKTNWMSPAQGVGWTDSLTAIFEKD